MATILLNGLTGISPASADATSLGYVVQYWYNGTPYDSLVEARDAVFTASGGSIEIDGYGNKSYVGVSTVHGGAIPGQTTAEVIHHYYLPSPASPGYQFQNTAGYDYLGCFTAMSSAVNAFINHLASSSTDTSYSICRVDGLSAYYTATPIDPPPGYVSQCDCDKGGCQTSFAQSCFVCPMQYTSGYGGLCYSNFTAEIRVTVSQHKNDGAPSCPIKAGNPIHTATGNKYQHEVDYAGAGANALKFERHYNSQTTLTATLGANWRHTYSRTLFAQDTTYGPVAIQRADGRDVFFALDINGAWVGDANSADRLEHRTDGTWKYTDSNASVEVYDTQGNLLEITDRNGLTTHMSYTQARLSSVTNAVGRTLQFGYDAQGRLHTVADPSGGAIIYNYSASNNLSSVTYPDLSTRQYLYENASFPHALTGIVDENGQRFATYSYDSVGRAISSEHAGGAGRVTLNYQSDGTTRVTDALGSAHTYHFVQHFGEYQTSAIDGGPCTGCGSAAQSYTYDANGWVIGKADHNGIQTTYTRDISGLETSRTEAAGTTSARTTVTLWVNALRLPSRIQRGGSAIDFSYDGLGRLLTKREVYALPAGSRTWTYAYNNAGMLSTVDGPRTDVADTTSYGYNASGDLISVTNPLGQITQITAYDNHGRPLSVKDPNGMVTQLTYNLRGRLITRTVGTEVTLFAYDSTGNLQGITHPDGTTAQYAYDAAHRLTGITDAAGNRIAYTLDDAGNRIKQEVFDAAGNVKRTHAQVFDELGQLFNDIGALNQTTVFSYDGNGNLINTTDAAGDQTSSSYDPLNRVVVVTDALNGMTRYSYDPEDRVTQVIDTRNAVTQYSYDGAGNTLQLTSPDSGVTTYTYDVSNNRLTQRDARNKVTRYEYDILNRVTKITANDGTITTYVYDVGANALGRLTSITDTSGSTSYSYDIAGRVISKKQIIGSVSLTTAYQYDTFGRLSRMTYPSGLFVDYTYSQGRVAGMSVNGQSVMSNITYSPFAAATGWTWGNGSTHLRQYNLDGQPTTLKIGATTRALHYDAVGNLDALTDPLSNMGITYDALHRVVQTTGSAVQSMAYDANGNRTQLIDNGTLTGYGFDAAGNRLMSRTGAQPASYTYDASGNMLSNGSDAFVYDDHGRFTSVNAGQATYNYNALGQRVRKDVNGGGSVTSGLTISRMDYYMRVWAVYPTKMDLYYKAVLKNGTASALTGGKSKIVGMAPYLSVLDGDVSFGAVAAGGTVLSQDLFAVRRDLSDPADPNMYDLSSLQWSSSGTLAATKVTTLFGYDEYGQLTGEYDANGAAVREIVWFGNQPVAVRKGASTYYIHTDHLNTPRAVVDATNKVIWSWNSDAFGATAANEDPDSDGVKFTFNLRFPGQYYDAETGLHYNYFRTYDPKTGRYTQSDPIGLAGGLNTYIYVRNNPLLLIDRNGLEVEVGMRQFSPIPLRYVRHCFVRFDGNSNDTLSFDNQGVHADPNPSGTNILNNSKTEYSRTTGKENDNCVRQEMNQCKGENYDFLDFNCCSCVSRALNACGLKKEGGWPNWPYNANNPPALPTK